MKNIITILICFISALSYSQIGIIKDKDGFTNVRKATDTKSEIIYKLKENEAFWFNDFGEDWIEVFIPQDKFSVEDTDDLMIGGYIHKSKVQRIENLTLADQDEVRFKYELREFKRENHIDNGNGKFVTKIDGRKIWGTDGNYPKIEIQKINASIKDKTIEIHKVLFLDLYECDTRITKYKNGNTYFIHQYCSDGAGFYELLWVINEEYGLTQRIVGSVI